MLLPFLQRRLSANSYTFNFRSYRLHSNNADGHECLIIRHRPPVFMGGDGLAQLGDELGGGVGAAAEGGFQAFYAEELAAGVAGFGDAVGVEEQGIAAMQGDGLILGSLACIDAEGVAGWK